MTTARACRLAGSVPADPGSVDVVFKGFAEQTDSFGCVKYTAEDFQKKAIGGKGVTPSTEICGCCALDWTGSFSLTASNLEVREEHARTHADARAARCLPSPCS